LRFYTLGIFVSGLLVTACGDDSNTGGSGAGGSSPGGAPQGGSPDGGAPQGGSPDGGAPQGGSPDGGAPQGGAPDGGAPQGGSANGGAGQGGSGGGGAALTCETGCEALFVCGLEMDGGEQLCPGFEAGDETAFVAGCIPGCTNNMALLSIIDPTDCPGTIQTVSAVSNQFAATCQNGL